MNIENDIKGNFTKISNFIIRDPNLSPFAKAIFILIKSYSPSYPSYSRILLETGIKSRSTVSKGLSELKAKNLIRVIDSPSHKSNLYEFPIPKKMDSISSYIELESVQEMDTNKTNLKILNNKGNEASTDHPVESSKLKEIFAVAESSLGTDARSGFKLKERPTFIIEASEK